MGFIKMNKKVIYPELIAGNEYSYKHIEGHYFYNTTVYMMNESFIPTVHIIMKALNFDYVMRDNYLTRNYPVLFSQELKDKLDKEIALFILQNS